MSLSARTERILSRSPRVYKHASSFLEPTTFNGITVIGILFRTIFQFRSTTNRMVVRIKTVHSCIRNKQTFFEIFYSMGPDGTSASMCVLTTNTIYLYTSVSPDRLLHYKSFEQSTGKSELDYTTYFVMSRVKTVVRTTDVVKFNPKTNIIQTAYICSWP